MKDQTGLDEVNYIRLKVVRKWKNRKKKRFQETLNAPQGKSHFYFPPDIFYILSFMAKCVI